VVRRAKGAGARIALLDQVAGAVVRVPLEVSGVPDPRVCETLRDSASKVRAVTWPFASVEANAFAGSSQSARSSCPRCRAACAHAAQAVQLGDERSAVASMSVRERSAVVVARSLRVADSGRSVEVRL